MATPAAATTDFVSAFSAHVISGLKLVGSFFVEFFRALWTVMWYGGTPTFIMFALVIVFFLIALVKFTLGSAKHLLILLAILAIISVLTAFGLLL